MTRNCRTLITAIAIALGSGNLRTAAQAPTGQPQSRSITGTYALLIGSGFLCEPGDSSMCPATVRSSSEDAYEMTGAGAFDTQGKSVKATGVYTHKSPNGNVLETGVWIASELLAFDSYGFAPAALMQKGPAFGRPQIGPQRLRMQSSQMPTGGLAIFRILLIPVSGTTTPAVLQVNCALGDVPRDRSVEGIRITLERNNSEYSEEASGRVMFLALRPEVTTPPKMPEQEAKPEALEQQTNFEDLS